MFCTAFGIFFALFAQVLVGSIVQWIFKGPAARWPALISISIGLAAGLFFGGAHLGSGWQHAATGNMQEVVHHLNDDPSCAWLKIRLALWRGAFVSRAMLFELSDDFPESIDLLIDAKAFEPNLVVQGTTPLAAATARGQLECVRRLLARGADPNFSGEGDERSEPPLIALLGRIGRGDPEGVAFSIMDALIAAGADPAPGIAALENMIGVAFMPAEPPSTNQRRRSAVVGVAGTSGRS